MTTVPVRKIVEVHPHEEAVLECGHSRFIFDYGATEAECQDCLFSVSKGIESLRGRLAFKCQTAVHEDVWDAVGETMRKASLWMVKDAIRYETDGDDIPF